MNIPEDERMGVRNALNYLSRAKTFLNWARLNGFMKDEVAGVLTFKLPERGTKRRLPFSQRELRNEKGSSESMNTYTHTISIKALKQAVDNIKYHIDFSHFLNPELNPWLK